MVRPLITALCLMAPFQVSFAQEYVCQILESLPGAESSSDKKSNEPWNSRCGYPEINLEQRLNFLKDDVKKAEKKAATISSQIQTQKKIKTMLKTDLDTALRENARDAVRR